MSWRVPSLVREVRFHGNPRKKREEKREEKNEKEEERSRKRRER